MLPSGSVRVLLLISAGSGSQSCSLASYGPLSKKLDEFFLERLVVEGTSDIFWKASYPEADALYFLKISCHLS